jgi:hypothetical protein
MSSKTTAINDREGLSKRSRFLYRDSHTGLRFQRVRIGRPYQRTSYVRSPHILDRFGRRRTRRSYPGPTIFQGMSQ